jgi:phytoene dehydrogenase-like protein
MPLSSRPAHIQFYPIGGFQRVPATLQSIAESHGATFHFSSPVRAVVRDKDGSGRAKGVELEDGTVQEADVVVVNADLAWAYRNLFVDEGKEGRGMEGKREPTEPGEARRYEGKPHS